MSLSPNRERWLHYLVGSAAILFCAAVMSGHSPSPYAGAIAVEASWMLDPFSETDPWYQANVSAVEMTSVQMQALPAPPTRPNKVAAMPGGETKFSLQGMAIDDVAAIVGRAIDHRLLF